jgi:hypothetical protein
MVRRLTDSPRAALIPVGEAAVGVGGDQRVVVSRRRSYQVFRFWQPGADEGLA